MVGEGGGGGGGWWYTYIYIYFFALIKLSYLKIVLNKSNDVQTLWLLREIISPDLLKFAVFLSLHSSVYWDFGLYKMFTLKFLQFLHPYFIIIIIFIFFNPIFETSFKIIWNILKSRWQIQEGRFWNVWRHFDVISRHNWVMITSKINPMVALHTIELMTIDYWLFAQLDDRVPNSS